MRAESKVIHRLIAGKYLAGSSALWTIGGNVRD
jgi:hypothetical protein